MSLILGKTKLVEWLCETAEQQPQIIKQNIHLIYGFRMCTCIKTEYIQMHKMS